MEKRIYIHIGTGKTGTTALQKFFWDNRAVLKRQGLLYPDYGVQGVAHHLIGNSWGGGWIPKERMWDVSPSEAWTHIRSLYESEKGSVLISSEALGFTFTRIPESAREVAKYLSGMPVKIILYLRRQDLHLESQYNQRVKGGVESTRFEDAKIPRFYNYAEYADLLASIFGEENVIVRPYERSNFKDGSIHADFLDILGMELSPQYVFPKSDPNPALSRSKVECCRLLNTIERPLVQKTQLNNLIQSLDGLLPFEKGDKVLFSVEERERFLQKYAESNSEVARRFLGRENGELFQDPVTHEDCKDGLLSLEDMAVVCVAVWKKMNDQQVKDMSAIDLVRIIGARVVRKAKNALGR